MAMSKNHTSILSDETQDSVLAKKSIVFALFLAALALLSMLTILALLIVPSTSVEYSFISLLDFVIAMVFLADFIRDFYRAESKTAYMRWGWVALLAGIPVLPGFPPIFNIVRLARLLRLIQIMRVLRKQSGRQLWTDVIRTRAKGSLLGVMLLGFLLLVISSFLIVRFESGAPGAEIDTVGEGLYWGVITLTTVGYGDFVPVTPAGRTLAGILIFIGIMIVAVATSFVTSSFQGGDQRQTDFDQLVADVTEMKALLQQLLNEKADEP
jgi:voltage-gated potassium channel